MARRTALAATVSLICSATAAQTTSLPPEPLMTAHPVIPAGNLTHVYDYEWFTAGARVDLGADTVFVCGYDGGRLYVTSARMVGSMPKSYDTRFAVYVTLAKVSATGEAVTVKSNYKYCSRCGRIARQTPTITLNGNEDETANLTYGDKLDHKTDARIEEAGNPAYIEVGGTQAFLDGDDEPLDRDAMVDAGSHTLRVVSAQIGNNNFSPSQGKVRVGYARTERTFTLSVAPFPLTVAQPLAIEPRPADGTTRLGRMTNPVADNIPDGGEDPGLHVVELDSSEVRPEPGDYTVRYRLAARSANYTVGAEWHETTFTITEGGRDAGECEVPTPDTAPEIFAQPLITLGAVLPDSLLTHTYDPEWYASGGDAWPMPPTPLTTWRGGTVLLTRAYIGHAAGGDAGGTAHYPSGYAEPLPVYAALSFASAAGDTTELGGRRVYCHGCGSVRRKTPVITVGGQRGTGDEAMMTYGEPLACRTSAKIDYWRGDVMVTEAGGVDITMDGRAAYNGDLPEAGRHSLTVASRLLGNDILDPARGQVIVGYARAARTFTLSVAPLALTVSHPLAIEPRPADGTTRLGRMTNPVADDIPDGGVDPQLTVMELDSSEVRPEPGDYTVRYRLAARSANYTVGAEWHETTFTITEGGGDAGESEVPTPDTAPELFAQPLMTLGAVLPDSLLTHTYDPEWYASGGDSGPMPPTPLTTWRGGTVLITRAYIGHAAAGDAGGTVRYPSGYAEPLPVYAALSFASAAGDTTDLDGRRVYCHGCGSVRRKTPVITVAGQKDGADEAMTTYGEPLACRTSAKIDYWRGDVMVTEAGGVDITMDGRAAYNGDLPDAGRHSLTVASRLLGNDILDPARGQVIVGYARAERTFTLTVAPLALTVTQPLAIEPRPADGTTRLGRMTNPVADDIPDGGVDPQLTVMELDSSEVRPEPGDYTVRYRLAARSANYTVDDYWRETTFTITEGEGEYCAKGIVRLKFGNTLIADNGGGEYKTFQWIADGAEIEGATRQYYHATPLPEAYYSVRLTKADGSAVETCPLRAGTHRTSGLSVRIAGGQAKTGSETEIAVDGAHGDEVVVTAYTASGVKVGSAKTGDDGLALMRLPRGLVIIRATAGGQNAEIRVACH